VSVVADFARELHEKHSGAAGRILEPIGYPSRSEILTDIRVVLFDVYGTLINYWRPEFSGEDTKKKALIGAFKETISHFGMERYLVEMNPQEPAEKTLWDLYHGLIALRHKLSLDKKIEFPEVKIEEVWNTIVLMLKRRGYAPGAAFSQDADASEFARCVAFYYNFYSFNRGLYPGVAGALKSLSDNNILLGIVSNAQFYTAIDLTLFLRDQTNGEIDDYTRLFDPDLLFFSFEYGVSKPNPLLFRKLFDALYELQILPSQALFVGNDLVSDIKPAQDAGMKTGFFTGDGKSAFFHDCAGKVVPDISFSAWDELPRRISFHSMAERQPLKGSD
jgi:putative hydrolase of the HAD superfamily